MIQPDSSPGIEGGSLPPGGSNGAWCIRCMDLSALLVLSLLGVTGAVYAVCSGGTGAEAL